MGVKIRGYFAIRFSNSLLQFRILYCKLRMYYIKVSNVVEVGGAVPVDGEVHFAALTDEVFP